MEYIGYRAAPLGEVVMSSDGERLFDLRFGERGSASRLSASGLRSEGPPVLELTEHSAVGQSGPEAVWSVTRPAAGASGSCRSRRLKRRRRSGEAACAEALPGPEHKKTAPQ